MALMITFTVSSFLGFSVVLCGVDFLAYSWLLPLECFAGVDSATPPDRFRVAAGPYDLRQPRQLLIFQSICTPAAQSMSLSTVGHIFEQLD